MALDPEVLDHTSALASAGGDPEFLREIAGLIQAAWPSLLQDIRKDLAAANLRGMEETARLAKAAAKYVSARRAYVAALLLELMATKRDLQGAQRATANLEEEVAKLQLVIPTLRNSHDSPRNES